MGMQRDLSPLEQADMIRAEAYRLGFSACGFAQADAVPRALAEGYDRWLSEAYHGEMSYLERNTDLRRDPRLLVEGTRTVLVVAMNYYPGERIDAHRPQFAYYAYGRDYHKVVKRRLEQLLRFIQEQIDPKITGRAFADSAPIMERYWAVQAGLGWLGKNGLLILPRAGSFFVLGELLLSLELPPSEPIRSLCGNCSRCLSACPTGALIAPGVMDARRCISYLTIEQRGQLPEELRAKIGRRVYGCDACQTCCPWNRFAIPTTVEDFELREVLRTLTADKLEAMTAEEFDHLFAGSPIRRAGLEGLQRSLQGLRDNFDD